MIRHIFEFEMKLSFCHHLFSLWCCTLTLLMVWGLFENDPVWLIQLLIVSNILSCLVYCWRLNKPKVPTKLLFTDAIPWTSTVISNSKTIFSVRLFRGASNTNNIFVPFSQWLSGFINLISKLEFILQTLHHLVAGQITAGNHTIAADNIVTRLILMLEAKQQLWYSWVNGLCILSF